LAGWQWFGRAHRAVYLATGGRVGRRLVGRDMLLLTTRGRRSGEPRTTPLSYLADRESQRGPSEDGQGVDVVVVASNNGAPNHPAWWLNLLAEPTATVQLGAVRYEAHAHLAEGDERERLWPLLVGYNPPYATYAKRTERQIPVVVLSPTGR
jgi:deazaflavin-dependent oxidoreductase (nitroreductase family)